MSFSVEIIGQIQKIIMNVLFNIEFDVLQSEFDRLERDISIYSPSYHRPYKIQKRLNPMDEYTEEEFRRRYRLSKGSVKQLYQLIGFDLEPLVARDNFTISGLDKILITLRYYATASFFRVSADCYGVSESSVCNIVPKVSEKIAALRNQFIKMPSTDAEIHQKKVDFFRVAGMPYIMCAIDGTLVKIQEVGGIENKTVFFSRKQFYGVNVQIACDANAHVMDIVARWGGSSHDSTVFTNSSIFERFSNGEFRRNNEESLMLGDGGYRSERFLAVPLRQTNQVQSRAEEMYQKAHISTRNVVERFNGQWKKRFPCLWIGMRFRKLDSVLDVIVATAVLHNMCKMNNDDVPPLTDDEEIQYNLAREHQPQNIQGPVLPNRIVNELLKNYYERLSARTEQNRQRLVL